MQAEYNIPYDPSQPLVIDKQVIEPGTEAVVRLDVGRLPSGNRIQISLFVYRAMQPGPVVLVMGGLHGDEINGVEIVRQAITSGLFRNLRAGSVIAVPVVNVFGFIHFSRDVREGKDVNRIFPGNQRGSLASRMAHMIARTVFPHAQIVIDFHTGGASRYNYPQVRFTKASEESLFLATLFGSRFILEKPVIRGSLRKVARDLNIPMLIYEGGEALRLDQFCIEKGLQGLRRILAFSQMIVPQTGNPAAEECVFVEKSSWLRASRAGIFSWTKPSGARIVKGEPLGYIADPFGSKTVPVLATRAGYILAHNNTPVVSQGDALFHIAYQFSYRSQPLLK